MSIEGINDVKQALERLKTRSSRQIGAIASEVLVEAIKLADRHTKSGRLVNALQMRKIGEFDYEVYSDKEMAPYAAFVHFKTRKHEIKPKKKSLRFTAGGGFIFAKSVMHPGYEGDPYMYTAAGLVSKRLTQIIERTE